MSDRNRNPNRSNGNGNQRRRQQPRRPADLWREPAPLPDIEPVVASSDPTALIRSLGDPPLAGTAATPHFAIVVERTAALATALALSADVLATDG